MVPSKVPVVSRPPISESYIVSNEDVQRDISTRARMGTLTRLATGMIEVFWIRTMAELQPQMTSGATLPQADLGLPVADGQGAVQAEILDHGARAGVRDDPEFPSWVRTEDRHGLGDRESAVVKAGGGTGVQKDHVAVAGPVEGSLNGLQLVTDRSDPPDPHLCGDGV